MSAFRAFWRQIPGNKSLLPSDAPGFAGAPRRSQEYELEAVKGYSGHMGREYLRSFVEAIRSGGEPPITGEDGVAALKVVEAVYRSAAEKKWVEVER